jgi:hypothetical protein
MNPPFPSPIAPDNPLMPQQRGQFVSVPSAPQTATGGMFGGGKFGIGQAIVAALNGYLAGTRGPSQQVGLNGLQMMDDQRKAMLEEKMYEHRQDLEMQRQLALLPIKAQLALQYPDGDFAQSLYASGIKPGSPEWTQAMQRRVQNQLDPLTMIPGGGMAPASVARAMIGSSVPAGAPAIGAVVDDPRKSGGQTAPQSGGFLGSGSFSDIGPYHRY